MVLTYVVMGAVDGYSAFLFNFAMAEGIGFIAHYLVNKGASMSKYFMERFVDLKSKFGCRGFGLTC